MNADRPQPRILRRLLREARPLRLHVTGIFVLELLSVPLALLTPVPLKIAIDSGIGDHPLPGPIDALLPSSMTHSRAGALAVAVALLVFVGVLDHGRGVASWVLGTYTGERLTLLLRSRLFRKVQETSVAYHDRRGTTDSAYRIQYDAAAIQSIVADGLAPFLVAGVTLVSMAYVTARLDWHIALAALGVAPLLLLVTRIYRARLRGGWLEVKNLESSAMGVIQETLSSLRVVKAFGREDHQQERFVGLAGCSMRGQVRLALIEGSLWALVGLTLVCGTGLVLYVGAHDVRAGMLTIGELLMAMAYVAAIQGPLETITSKIAELQSGLASAERTFFLLDALPEVEELPHARPLGRARGEVIFDHVSYAYGPGEVVLHDLSLSVPAGTRIGLSGATGAGKTTLASLLNRLYDVTEGRILLDGIDIREYRLADLRRQFAVVLQDPVLFSASIAENIAYARPGASMAEIVGAAKAADAHDFILDTPAGYDTFVGERGARLSGGQRQRISLARAFLKDAPILILDEPTSAVDAAAEARIMDFVDRLMAGRTSFVISHRRAPLSRCTQVLTLRDGTLVAPSGPGFAGKTDGDAAGGRVAAGIAAG